MEPSANQLPPDISLDFAMTERNLWAVWCGRDSVLKLIGDKREFYFNWYLADSFEQILEKSKSIILAAVSLEEIKTLVDLLGAQAPWWKPLPKTFFVKRGAVSMWVDKIQDGDKKLFSGNLSDLKKILNEGKIILENKDYTKVYFDSRPLINGHPIDWIDFMRDPNLAMDMRNIDKEYGFKDPTQ